MSEPEDLVVDVARHATIFIRDTWRRHYPGDPDEPVALASLARRLDLLLSAATATSLPMRVALPPARPTMLHRVFKPGAYPRHRQALPATNDDTIWLPAQLGTSDPVEASELYRAMALQQAFRARRGSARAILAQPRPLLRDTALVLEAQAAEAEVARGFPGLVPALARLRGRALAGAQGNAKARIFCREFHAELVAVAGHYKVLEDIPSDLRGKAVQVWLDGDQLKIAALD